MRTWLILIACLALGCAPSPVTPSVIKPPAAVTVTVPMFSVSAVTLDVGDTLVIATQDGTPWTDDYAEGMIHKTAPWTWTRLSNLSLPLRDHRLSAHYDGLKDDSDRRDNRSDDRDRVLIRRAAALLAVCLLHYYLCWCPLGRLDRYRGRLTWWGCALIAAGLLLLIVTASRTTWTWWL